MDRIIFQGIQIRQGKLAGRTIGLKEDQQGFLSLLESGNGRHAFDLRHLITIEGGEQSYKPMLRVLSYSAISASCFSVVPISSRPSRRQVRENASMANCARNMPLPETSHCSRSILSR